MADAAGWRRATWNTGRRPPPEAAGATPVAAAMVVRAVTASFRPGRLRGRRLTTGNFARCLVEQRFDFAAAQRL